jgi:hypothetical protein
MTKDAATPTSEGLGFRPGCGPACPYRDWVSGICERHGPTESDRIIERVTEAFRRDIRRIMGGRNGR